MHFYVDIGFVCKIFVLRRRRLHSRKELTDLISHFHTLTRNTDQFETDMDTELLSIALPLQVATNMITVPAGWQIPLVVLVSSYMLKLGWDD
jgi:hypothetical protein